MPLPVPLPVALVAVVVVVTVAGGRCRFDSYEHVNRDDIRAELFGDAENHGGEELVTDEAMVRLPFPRGCVVSGG